MAIILEKLSKLHATNEPAAVEYFRTEYDEENVAWAAESHSHEIPTPGQCTNLLHRYISRIVQEFNKGSGNQVFHDGWKIWVSKDQRDGLRRCLQNRGCYYHIVVKMPLRIYFDGRIGIEPVEGLFFLPEGEFANAANDY